MLTFRLWVCCTVVCILLSLTVLKGASTVADQGVLASRSTCDRTLTLSLHPLQMAAAAAEASAAQEAAAAENAAAGAAAEAAPAAGGAAEEAQEGDGEVEGGAEEEEWADAMDVSDAEGEGEGEEAGAQNQPHQQEQEQQQVAGGLLPGVAVKAEPGMENATGGSPSHSTAQRAQLAAQQHAQRAAAPAASGALGQPALPAQQQQPAASASTAFQSAQAAPTASQAQSVQQPTTQATATHATATQSASFHTAPHTREGVVKEWRALAVCIKEMGYTEKGARRMMDLLKCYKHALGDKEVFDVFWVSVCVCV